MTHMSRAVKAEELLDVQQQADFFISLGQHEQAIEVLQEHINANVQTSALVYLDLFKLYHLLGRESDYERLRTDFGQLFNAKMPEFALYTDASPGLEAYPATLNRIEMLWSSFKVLNVIEESIFRKRDSQIESFDVGAYRELLLLYAIAKEVVSQHEGGGQAQAKGAQENGVAFESSGNTGTGHFHSTSIQPPSASAVNYLGRQDAAVLSKSSQRLGLDIDLSDLLSDQSAHGIDSAKPGEEAESDAQFFTEFANGVTITKNTALHDASTSTLPTSQMGNLIDFETSDSSIQEIERQGRPRS